MPTDTTQTSQPATIDQVADLIGRPYIRDQDCNWLMAEVARRLGTYYPDLVTPPDPADWPAMFAQSLATYARACDCVPGCIAIFRFIDDHEKEHWHCGTVLAAAAHQPTAHRLITTIAALGVHVIPMTESNRKWRIWELHCTGYYHLRRPTP